MGPHTPSTIVSPTNGTRNMTSDGAIDRARQLVVSGIGFGNRSSGSCGGTSGRSQAVSVCGGLDHAEEDGVRPAHEQYPLENSVHCSGVAPHVPERVANDCRILGSEMYQDMY
jgi:hypothetical protein